ncbi:MAG: hypothetical protein ACI3W5_13305 [Faecousia sp.]
MVLIRRSFEETFFCFLRADVGIGPYIRETTPVGNGTAHGQFPTVSLGIHR